MSDEFEVTIMEDGSVKVETFGTISEINHLSAEKFLKELAGELGVTPEKIRKSVHKHKHRDRIRR